MQAWLCSVQYNDERGEGVESGNDDKTDHGIDNNIDGGRLKCIPIKFEESYYLAIN